MRHRHGYRKLGRTSSHRKALFKNMSIAMITHERIETTAVKAKELSSFVEKLITKAGKGGDVAHKYAFSILQDKEATKKLLAEIAPRYVDRKGGYTRIIKTRIRRGDAAPMAIIELV